MSKLTGPLFSLDARGTVGDTLTYSFWRGVNYVRRRVIPTNPNTADQQEVRNIFSSISAMWSRSPTLTRAPWIAAATGQPFTDRNLQVRNNVPALNGDTDLADLVHSPGMGGAIPPESITVTAGVGQLTVAVTAPTLPSGWTIQAAVAQAVEDGDFSTNIVRTPVAGEDTTSPYSIVLTGLDTVLHYVGAWLRWTAPDGSTRYSVAVTGSGTPT